MYPSGQQLPLKGFQLWLAENRSSLETKHDGLDANDINAKGLEAWKMLPKEEKEAYKVARVPKAAKRKREDDGSGSLGKIVKTN